MSVVRSTQAVARLVLSRERLRQALRDKKDPPGLARKPRFGGAWMAGLKSIPGAGVVIDAMHRWWTQHPLRMAAMAAADAAKIMVQPLAQRHPLGLVFGVFLLGGLLARSHPWRTLATPALLVGLLPQILSKVMSRASEYSRSPPRSPAD